eukprot:TRINITY_DN18943_c0_g1_i1.p1 TRINITY_DN18943_c0_g1~~TRINITY_DN18943_c0_g1_i1.p1  ORF type:complete len:538 (-),score=123.83 TRINITY_DN18943_c0_g1_i1:158-1771(-)
MADNEQPKQKRKMFGRTKTHVDVGGEKEKDDKENDSNSSDGSEHANGEKDKKHKKFKLPGWRRNNEKEPSKDTKATNNIKIVPTTASPKPSLQAQYLISQDSKFFGFEDSIQTLWLRPIEDLPVYKDIPRLAIRTVVKVSEEAKNKVKEHRENGNNKIKRANSNLTEEKKAESTVFSVWINSGIPQTRARYKASHWGMMPQLGTIMVSDERIIEEDEESASTEEKLVRCVSVYDNQAKLLTTTLACNVFQCIDSTRYFVLSIPKDPSSFSARPNPSATNEDSSSQFDYWGVAFGSRPESQKFVTELEVPVAPASTSALSERSSSSGDLNAVSVPPINSSLGDTPPVRSLRAMRCLMKDVSDWVEEKEEGGETQVEKGLKEKLDKHIDEGFSGDLELLCREMFEQVLGMDSKTAKILKTINQSFVFKAAVELKTKVMKGIMTKDDRSENGWRIVIEVEVDCIKVHHIRREQSLPTAGKTQGFWMEYSMCIEFDRQVNDIKHVSLKVSDLQFEPETEASFKENISRILQNGKLVVHDEK